MDDFTRTITLVSTVCIGLLGLAATAAALYGILVWFPRYQNKKVENLKANGRQGRAVILQVPESVQRYNPSRKGIYTLVTLRLEIDVPGVEIYQLDKTFTFPTGHLSSLEVGKTVDVWIDPRSPRDTSKIVIHVQ